MQSRYWAEKRLTKWINESYPLLNVLHYFSLLSVKLYYTHNQVHLSKELNPAVYTHSFLLFPVSLHISPETDLPRLAITCPNEQILWPLQASSALISLEQRLMTGCLPLFSPSLSLSGSLSPSLSHLPLWSLPQDDLPSHFNLSFWPFSVHDSCRSPSRQGLKLSLPDIHLIHALGPSREDSLAKDATQLLLNTYSQTISACLLTVIHSMHHYLYLSFLLPTASKANTKAPAWLSRTPWHCLPTTREKLRDSSTHLEFPVPSLVPHKPTPPSSPFTPGQLNFIPVSKYSIHGSSTVETVFWCPK